MLAIGITATLISAICFAMFIVISPIIYGEDVHALQSALLRVCAMMIFFGTMKLIYRQSFTLPKSHLQKLPLLGYGLGMGCMGIFYLQAVAYIPVSVAVMIFYTWPIVTALSAPMVGRPLPGPRQTIALTAAFACLIFAIGPQLGELNPMGMLMAFAAALSISVSMHSTYLAYPASSGLSLGFYGGVIAVMLTVPVAFFSGVDLSYSNFNDKAVWLAVLLCLLYLGGNGGQIVCAKYLRPEFVAIFYNIEPVVALLGAYVLLDERLSMMQYIACTGVILCLLMYRGFANERAIATERMQRHKQ